MKANEIYFKTMTFVWMKLGLGAITFVVSAILLGILLGIGMLFGDGVAFFMFLIWLGAVGVIRLALMHYMGYLVKAGHIAVITEAITTGNIPSQQFEHGKKMVTERFATSNVYFAVDKLVSGAVKQIQNMLEKAGNLLDNIPGMDALVGVAKLFVSISLGYIDECCLGYTFYKKEQGAFKSAADGVAIYAQNWKHLLKNALKTTALVLLITAGITLVVFIVIGLLFRALDWNGMIAFVLAIFIALIIKNAFIDSWILVKNMCSYMEVAPMTQITFDVYGKLSEASSSFRNLFEKGQNEKEPGSMNQAPFA